MHETMISGRKCLMHEAGKPLRAVYVINDHPENIIAGLAGFTDYVLIFFSVSDWNRDLSPWPYRMNRNFDFAGNGQETQKWLIRCTEHINELYGSKLRHYVCGYSLAGLFSLWCLYETDVFSGAGSFSGSLWFEGWHDYVENGRVRADARVYLSLGDRENHTRNPVMARVLDETVHQHEVLKEQCECCFRLNEGGHFDNVTERVLEGIRWLLNGDID